MTCYIKKSALSPPLGRKVSDEFNVPLRRAIIARSIAVAMKPHCGKMPALIRPSLPARFGWRRIRADNYGQNGQRSSKFYWVITQRRRLRCGSRADHGNRRLTLRWMNELKRDAARFAIDCEIGIER